MNIVEKIDISYVATVTGDLGFCIILNKICQELGLSLLVIISNKRDYKYLLEQNILALYVGPHCFLPTNKTIFELNAHEESYVNCENSYYGVFKKIIRLSLIRMKILSETELAKYKIGIVLQNPGGEILRGLIHNYCKVNNVKIIYFGEYFKEYCGSVLYSDDRKKLINNPFLFEKGYKEFKEIENGDVVQYTLPSIKYKSGLRRVIDLVISGDAYAFFSAVGYRLEKLKSKINSAIVGLLSVNQDSIKRDDGREKILIAMNVLAESELYIRNEIYSDPLHLLKRIKELQEKYIVYVKGHPGDAKSFRVRDAVKFRLNGIKILDKQIPASKIIRHFDVIGFVSSTVGIEAIRENVPILCLGNWPYRFIAEAAAVETVDKFLSIKVNKDKFFEHLSKYIHPGKSYGSNQELKIMIQSIAKLHD